MTANSLASTHRTLLETAGLTLATPDGRVLLRDLDLVLDTNRVALVGRNGVGKSSLLATLAGHNQPHRGVVRCRAERLLVRQELGPQPDDVAALFGHDRLTLLADPDLPVACDEAGLRLDALQGSGLSRGERRKLHLLAARWRSPDLLLLDEPTEDLDVTGIDWLCRWLESYPGGLLVVSHHRQLLRAFRHFFILAESGSRYFAGSFDELERDLRRRYERGQASYARKLNTLLAREGHDATVRRRRRRKKNLGRLHEEGRAPSRAQLKGKKGYAQKSQAKAAKIRRDRITADREWTRAARRALSVRLPLQLPLPQLPPHDGRDVVRLSAATIVAGGRRLVSHLDLRFGRDRLAVIGPNGAGKSTLLRVLSGELPPTAGRALVQRSRIGSIAQGAHDWCVDDTLVERLLTHRPDLSAEAVAELVVTHAFPLGLALRPLRSLSAGERTRAALIALYLQAPELLILDEPSYSLDFVGVAALAAALTQWPGGLVVASHDRGFLDDIAVHRHLELDGAGSHRFVECQRR